MRSQVTSSKLNTTECMDVSNLLQAIIPTIIVIQNKMFNEFLYLQKYHLFVNNEYKQSLSFSFIVTVSQDGIHII